MSGSVEGVVSNRDPYSDRVVGPEMTLALFVKNGSQAFKRAERMSFALGT
jgi:hypothetical protein